MVTIAFLQSLALEVPPLSRLSVTEQDARFEFLLLPVSSMPMHRRARVLDMGHWLGME